MRIQQLLSDVKVVFIVCVSFLLSVAKVSIAEPEPNDLRADFERHYQLWKFHCLSVNWSSESGKRLDCAHYRAIVAMGPKVLPYIVEKHAAEPNFGWTGWAWIEVGRIIPDPKINPWAQESMLNWWQGRQEQVNNRFESTYRKWKDFKAQGLSAQADKMSKSIRALGIGVLPPMVEKLRLGDNVLLLMIRDITGGEANISGRTTSEQTQACLAWWDKDKEKWLIPFPNKKPKANAGKDMTVTSGDTVQLDGSASSDADKDKLTYKWTQVAGPPVKLSDEKAVKPTFTAPDVNQPAVLTFQLTVNDGSPKKSAHPSCESGESKPTTVSINVKRKS